MRERVAINERTSFCNSGGEGADTREFGCHSSWPKSFYDFSFGETGDL